MKDLDKIGLEGMDWIDFEPEQVQWRALMTTVMTIWVSENAGSFLIGWATLSLLAPPWLSHLSLWKQCLKVPVLVMLTSDIHGEI